MKSHHLADATLLIDKQISSHNDAITRLNQLKKSLTHDAQHVVEPRTGDLALNQLDLRILAGLHQRALTEGRDRVEFKGVIMMTDYVGYVIEYTESCFSKSSGSDEARR